MVPATGSLPRGELQGDIQQGQLSGYAALLVPPHLSMKSETVKVHWDSNKYLL